MRRKTFSKTNFYFDFFEKRLMPDVFSSIHFKNDSKAVFTKTSRSFQEIPSTYVVASVPDYFDFELVSTPNHNLRKLFWKKGYAIAFSGFDNVTDFIKKNRSSNFRTMLRRKIKGLESCFEVRYKMFHGQMDRAEYDLIMNTLQKMLSRRFKERNEENMALTRWNEYYDNAFNLINEEKASLYVIYDDEKPIQISLSFHWNKLVYLAVPSYDIDYSKFGLGNLAVYKLLDWSITNGYEMLDMGFGAFEYKLKWCNKIYDFEHHLFYNKASLFPKITVRFIALKTRLINYLIDKKVNVHYRRWKAQILGIKKNDWRDPVVEKEISTMPNLVALTKIQPLTNDAYAFLRRALYDFVYGNLEPVSDIEVYELEKNSAFLFVGKSHNQKVTFLN